MVFLESFKGGAKSFQFDSKGCVESIKRVFQDTFRVVSGVFLRVFEASSKGVLKEVIEVYGNLGVSKNFRGV